MHIAIVRTEFDALHGGAERYAVNLARTWLEHGHRISVVCTRARPEDAEGMEVIRVSRPKPLGPWKHAWFARRAGRAARASGADAVLCLARAWPGDVLRLGDGLHLPWLAVRYPSRSQRKLAAANPRHRELLSLERQLFRPGAFGRYVANSELVRRHAIRLYDVPADRVEVIPNGVDISRYRLEARRLRGEVRGRHGIPEESPLVLFSGMDFRRKGLEAAAAGFAAFARAEGTSRPWFVCVGKGDPTVTRQALEQAGLAERALFLSPSDRIEEWYGAADLLLLPTLYDPAANAVTEALACGLPVITSRRNGARDHIADGQNGVVLRRRDDPAEIAQAIRSVLTRRAAPEEVARLGGLISVGENAARLLEILRLAAEERKSLSGYSERRRFSSAGQAGRDRPNDGVAGGQAERGRS